MPHARSAYVCYFGLREPLVQTQVLPYLRAIAASGVEVTLLTFEPASPAWTQPALAEATHDLAAAGIGWQHRRYHGRPSLAATLVDVAVGARFVRRACRRGGVGLVHARGHVPALMGALGAPRGTKLLFDDRGFMPEEYVDAGVWRAGGVVFRAMKAVERHLLRRADAVVVLTERARGVLAPQLAAREAGAPPVAVIPCCVDLAAFPLPTADDRAAAKQSLGLSGRTVALYLGSSRGTYLLEELADFVMTLRDADPDTYLLALTPRDVTQVAGLLCACGLDRSGFSVRSVPPAEVARYAAAADVGLCFVRPTYAKAASSPTKVAEYLASGLPVVVTAGVGDLDAQVGGSGVGVLVHELDRADYRRAGAELRRLLDDPGLAGRCRRTAEARFGLETVGAPRYRGLYDHLLGRPPP